MRRYKVARQFYSVNIYCRSAHHWQFLSPHFLSQNAIEIISSATRLISASNAVTSSEDITNCSLIFDNSVYNILANPAEDATLGMYNSSLSVATHTWSINCTDSACNTNSSESRILTVSYTEVIVQSSGGGGGGGTAASKTYVITTEQVSATEVRKIVLATNISISSKSTRSIGNIENSGPIPPKVNTPTTYTIIWSIVNSFNQVSNVEVKATLPSYVKWTELKNPAGEIFSFDSITNEVVWNVGSVLPNTGFGSAKKEIQFQLEFLPSSSQLGETPIILWETSLSGVDKVTGQKITAKAPATTINFSSDSTFKSGDDKVVQ